MGQHTMLAKIIKMVEDAQVGKAPIQALADRISGYFVPTVLSLGLLTLVGWSVYLSNGEKSIPAVLVGNSPGDDARWAIALKLCISVIVIACPCALGLATPTAIMVGTGVGARLGILIKGGGALEKARNISALVIDKTGTLTSGIMKVEDIITLVPTVSRSDIITIAGIAESGSEHPLGKAIVAHYKQVLEEQQQQQKSSSDAGQLLDFDAVPGSGLKATVRYKGRDLKVTMGSMGWLKSEGNPEGLQRRILDLQKDKGYTVILVVIDSVLSAAIALSDQLKPDAKEAVQIFQDSMGLRVIMATGDQRATAERFAQDLGLSPENDVKAQMSPADKAQLVQDLQNAGHVVGMIGDGINDSPALAQADVGFTLNSGTDIAMQVAEIVLMQDSLVGVATAIHLSRIIVRRIYLNFIWACLYNIIGIPIAAGLFAYSNIWISPPLAAAAMALSSISVICSSLLLKRYKPPRSYHLHNRRLKKSFFSNFWPFNNGRMGRYRLSDAGPNAAYIPLTDSHLV